MVIETFLIGITASVIANGLTSVARSTSQAGGGDDMSQSQLRDQIENDSNLSDILRDAQGSVAFKTVADSPLLKGKLRLFVLSPEVQTVVRQIFASHLTEEMDGRIGAIRTEFGHLFRLRVGESADLADDLASELFESLLLGCNRALGIAINQGSLSAHEAKSEFRYRVVRDELANLQKNLDILTRLGMPDVDKFLEFESKFRAEIGARHGEIRPPHFDAATRVPIDDLYVAPHLTQASSPRLEQEPLEEHREPIDDYLSTLYRGVILGNPGGGKTTLTYKLCHDLATRYDERLLAGRAVTPILVVLREYGAEKKTHNCSILKFMETKAESRYQNEPPEGAFKYLLLSGRAFVIFDGLDELLDTSDRQEIAGDIESFCRLYPAVPVLVTSRVVGYDQAPLDNRMFDVARLGDFSDEQVDEYVKKWFAIDADLNADEAQDRAEAFMTESVSVADLRANPLMLALMCNLYRGDGYIPQNRPDVYEKCAVMLFERWDKNRGIHTPLRFESQLRSVMSYLAYQTYSEDRFQDGISHEELVEETVRYLLDRTLDDEDEARTVAEEFINFFRGRAWVFTDVGLTSQDAGLYQFTHRTFLEYFTALYLVRNYRSPEDLTAELSPHIKLQEWDVVCQLAIQLKNNSMEGATDDILSILLKTAEAEGYLEQFNYLSFVARTLEFLVPRPDIKRKFVASCVKWSINWIEKLPEHERTDATPSTLFDSVAQCSNDNVPVISSTIKDISTELLNEGGSPGVLFVSEIALELNRAVRVGSREPYWRDVTETIVDENIQRLISLADSYFVVGWYLYWRGIIDSRQFFSWYGVEGLFAKYNYVTSNIVRVPLAEVIISGSTYTTQDYMVPGVAQRYRQMLQEIGRELMAGSVLWYKKSDLKNTDAVSPKFAIDHEIPRWADLHEASAFGVFTLYATKVEQFNRIDSTSYLNVWDIYPEISETVTRRMSVDEMIGSGNQIDHDGFNDDQRAFIKNWLERKVNITK